MPKETPTAEIEAPETPTAPGPETPSAGDRVASVKMTPMLVKILKMFAEAGDKGLNIDKLYADIHAPLRAAKRPCPPLDEHISNLMGATGSGDGLIEQCQDQEHSGEWMDRHYKITDHGIKALEKLGAKQKAKA